jgi:hypothetical protein
MLLRLWLAAFATDSALITLLLAQLSKGLDEIRKDKSIALLGAMQALFEGAMYTCMS